jgi:membrane-associated protease RseP (regulator of RpoE activity)
MRRTFLPALASLTLLVGQTVLAQAPTLLNQLEQRNQGAAAGAAAVPGTGYLGAVVDDDAVQGRGVRVISAKPGAPAAASGLRDGDLIVAVDGKPVTGLTQLDDVLDRAVPGQKLQVSIDRSGSRQQLTITLGTRPAPTDQDPGEPSPAAPSLAPPATSPAPPASGSPALGPPSGVQPQPTPDATETAPRGSGIRATPLELGPPPSDTPAAPSYGAAPPTASGASLGITVVPLTEPARASSSLPVRRGALVAAVKAGSPADTAGVPVGGVIVRIDNRPVDSADDLVSAIKAARPGQEVELTYYEGDRLGRKLVRLGPASAAAAPGAPSGGGLSAPGVGFGAAAPEPGTPEDRSPRNAAGSGGGRPLLNRIERMTENLTRPAGTSTVYNPQLMAELQTRVVEMGEEIKALEERIKALESKLGVGGAPAAPGPALGSNAP